VKETRPSNAVLKRVENIQQEISSMKHGELSA